MTCCGVLISIITTDIELLMLLRVAFPSYHTLSYISTERRTKALRTECSAEADRPKIHTAQHGGSARPIQSNPIHHRTDRLRLQVAETETITYTVQDMMLYEKRPPKVVSLERNNVTSKQADSRQVAFVLRSCLFKERRTWAFTPSAATQHNATQPHVRTDAKRVSATVSPEIARRT